MYKITDEFFRSSGPLTAPRAGPGHNNSSSPPFSSASSSSFPTSFAARTAPFEEANFGKGPAPMTEGCQKVIAASEKLTRVAEKLNNVGPDKFFRRYFPRNYGRVVSTWEAVEGKVNALWDGLGLGKGGWLGSRIKGDSGAGRIIHHWGRWREIIFEGS